MTPRPNRFQGNSELIMISFAISILLILFIPIPAALLDFLLIINFSWALTILLLTFYTDKPLSFSTFPALLLLSTLFRLALNISATRLILAEGNAGQVIQTMGQYVIGGNYVMGLVVFLILIIIQYLVITNGAQRVAEVAARFTLDSMPGKQMSIDADLNMGIISHAEAKLRRAQIEKEANFYGSMDGASKFVKGDAIAGILIILVDIIGGLAIGMAQKGFTLSESIQRYTLLTVGDGLVTQIPALIISTATGIIVTRAATDTQLGSEIAKQIAAYPKSLIMVCVGLLSLLLLNGIPALPVLTIFGLFATATWHALRTKTEEIIEENEVSLYDKIKIYPVEIHLHPELFTRLAQQEQTFLQYLQQVRERIAFELGFVIPEIKLLSDKKLSYPFYHISIQGNNQGGHHPLYFDKMLALASSRTHQETLLKDGIAVRDPSYGLAAAWIDPSQQTKAVEMGYTLCDPINVLITHLKEVVYHHIADLLTRTETEILLEQTNVRHLRDELIPTLLPLSQVQCILKNLLQEKVPIRYLSTILEVLLEHAKTITDPTQLTELVRMRLGTAICQKLLINQDSLQVLTLAPVLEQKLNQNLGKDFWALEPSLTENFITSLANQVEKMLGERKRPVLLCSSALRRPIKQLTQRVIPHLTVLAMNEIPISIQVESFAVVQ
ncbi:flagellar biosynthesis protein FlhA [Legionella maceachernii]|uniref:Flagellar biosynthesis protein FlhA n=1 Tax=Legionella maceachernii TaxID=466 RepID=A0A0W0W1P9_9GAMM|nr:flagellar biosynthesis protein FlhA [Legionella maceachernii]KTD25846.1 flagellar biosynthesis protein FlhA [Legionella maceachernii]SJZ46813.1 flagellar biosynthesis protein FlhA [Legionella maceachernii]SUP03964.1 Flagellar biosynthesis protein flhA [Legionella maceachernii]